MVITHCSVVRYHGHHFMMIKWEGDEVWTSIPLD